MNWQSLLPAELEPLAAHLTLETAKVDRRATRLLVCFLADRLVGEKEYLALRGALQRHFPGVRVSLRVCSPALAGEARRELAQYAAFLTDCHSPMPSGQKMRVLGSSPVYAGQI